MPITTDPYVKTDFPVQIAEVVTDMVLEELFPKTFTKSFFTDLSDEFADGGEVAAISDFYTNTFTVTERSTPVAEVTTQSVAEVKKTFSLGNPKEIVTAIGDEDYRKLRTRFNFLEMVTRKMGGTLRTQFEKDVLANYASITDSITPGAATALADKQLRQAIGNLDKKKVDRSDIAFVFHTDVYWGQVAAIQKIYDAAMRGSTQSILARGALEGGDPNGVMRGVLYDVPLFVSPVVAEGVETTVTYKYNMLVHKQAIAYAFGALQRPPTRSVESAVRDGLRTTVSYEHRNKATLLSVDTQYGTGVLRPDLGVVIKTDVAVGYVA